MSYIKRQPVTTWKSWHDVFIEAKPIADIYKYSGSQPRHIWRQGAEQQILSSFMSLHCVDGERIFMDVMPTQAAIDKVREHSLFIENDSLNFEAIEWSDNRGVLIACHNSRILGGCWLAIIEASTIPTHLR